MVVYVIILPTGATILLKMLRKLPYTEIIVILPVLYIIFQMEVISFALCILCFEDCAIVHVGNFLSSLGDFFLLLLEQLSLIGYVIVVLLSMVTVSINKLFIKIFNNYSHSVKIRLFVYLILLCLSPAFLFGVYILHPLYIVLGFYYSLCIPVMLSDLYLHLHQKVSCKQRINYSIILLLFILSMSFVCYLSVLCDFKINEFWRILPHYIISIISCGVLFVTTDIWNIIKNIKRKLLYLIPVLTLILIYLIKTAGNPYVIFCVTYILSLLAFICIFSTPILKLKAKNLKLRREIEKGN